MLKAFLPAMIERNDGHIVSVASTAGYFGVPRLGAYCSSKAAALNLHYSLVAELAAADEGALGTAALARRADRIGSTVVCPYFLRGTHMQLVGDRNECACASNMLFYTLLLLVFFTVYSRSSRGRASNFAYEYCTAGFSRPWAPGPNLGP